MQFHDFVEGASDGWLKKRRSRRMIILVDHSALAA
jgi:hypothetical protein